MVLARVEDDILCKVGKGSKECGDPVTVRKGVDEQWVECV